MLTILILLAAFDPTATLQALQHPEGRNAALTELLALNPPELQAARQRPELAAVMGLIAQDRAAGRGDRALAIRAFALLGLRQEGGLEILAALLKHGEDPAEVALAREAALALRQLKAPGRLEPALDSKDPEVRQHAAAAGAGGARLCLLLKADPWPIVRRAAAVGLPAQHADCLAAAFNDEHRVAIAAVEAAGRVKRPALKAPLMALAGDRKRAPRLRASALGALGALGELGPAKVVIEAHLAKGGILPLVEGALRACFLDGGPEAREILKAALGSSSERARYLAGRALLQLGERAAVEARLSGWSGRARARLEALIKDPIDPAIDDPE